jgi:putrescine transport system substrate-binding protein
VFPPEAELKKMAQPDGLSNDIRRQVTRIYTAFKTGL